MSQQVGISKSLVEFTNISAYQSTITVLKEILRSYSNDYAHTAKITETK